jgi:hypothetical protein
MVPAMVCLVLVGLLCAAVLRLAQSQRGVVAAEERRMQAEWLAESGLARAAARLAADPGYKGETWDVAAGALGGAEPGVVRIAVEAVKDAPGRRRVRAEADYPGGTSRRARLSKELILDVGNERPGGPS